MERKIAPRWLTLAAVCWVALVCAGGAAAAVSEEDPYNIPAHLLNCYSDYALYHRERRLPASMPVLVGMLRQVEETPGFTMDARSFTLSLLHMFRVDGIERDPTVVASEHTVPFGLTGQQYYKHRILMRSLIPRSSFAFPNETLSDIEKCSLHFMMSNSLDKVQRGDEHRTCSVVAAYRAPATSGRRYKREASAPDNNTLANNTAAPSAPAVPTAAADPAASAVPAAPADPAASANPTVKDDGDFETEPVNGDKVAAPAPVPAAAGTASGPTADNPDAEMVTAPHGVQPPPQPASSPEQKGNLVWDADGPGARGSGRMQASPGAAARTAPGATRAAPGAAAARFNEATESECPVENGVVYTRWGSVQLGSLLAGIAAGFETQVVASRNIRGRAGPARSITGLSDTLEIDSRYAATLAGDLAEIALWRGPRNIMKVGASGNWNSTQSKHWYFIEAANEMTDAEIRGGLDGLIMAHHVKEWNNKANGGLRLSSILERYYSVRGVLDEDYRACERQNHYKNVAKIDTLNTQAKSFASVLYDAVPTMPVITSLGLSEYASKAVEALDVTVRASKMVSNCDATLRFSGNTQPEPKLNIIFVTDCLWPYKEISAALESFAENINLHPLESRLTVLGAATHQVLFNLSDRINTFSENLIKNFTEYQQCQTGMKLHDLLDNKLRDYFTDQLLDEKDNSESSILSNVVIIMPDTSYDIPSQEIRQIENRMNEYRKNFPDVKFLFFTSQMKESFKLLVEDYEKDIIIFQYSSGSPINTLDLVQRLTTVPRRIANPTCGPNFQESKYDAVHIYETIPNKQIAYYRIHPKYLFGIESETIKIREQNTGTITVCHSRKDETPHENDDDNNDDDDSNEDDSDCKSISGSEMEINLKTPCSGSSSYQTCKPLYISIEVTDSLNKCAESACRDVDDVAVEIIHSGLTCGAAVLKGQITFAFLVILMISKILFSG